MINITRDEAEADPRQRWDAEREAQLLRLMA